jgi:hypothetical protein
MILELLLLEARVALIPQVLYDHAEYVLNDSKNALTPGAIHAVKGSCCPERRALSPCAIGCYEKTAALTEVHDAFQTRCRKSMGCYSPKNRTIRVDHSPTSAGTRPLLDCV